MKLPMAAAISCGPRRLQKVPNYTKTDTVYTLETRGVEEFSGKELAGSDDLSLLLPAFFTNRAAYHTTAAERLIKAELTIQQWDYQVTTAGYLHSRRSIWFGELFQRPMYVSIGSAALYWATAAIARVRIWLNWLSQQAT